MIDMENNPEDCVPRVKEWILIKKDLLYKEFLKTDTEQSEDLNRYENEIELLGKKLMRAIQSENLEELNKLGWPEELMECIRDPSVNLVIYDFIELSCLRFPNTHSLYNLKILGKQNVGLE